MSFHSVIFKVCHAVLVFYVLSIVLKMIQKKNKWMNHFCFLSSSSICKIISSKPNCWLSFLVVTNDLELPQPLSSNKVFAEIIVFILDWFSQFFHEFSKFTSDILIFLVGLTDYFNFWIFLFFHFKWYRGNL